MENMFYAAPRVATTVLVGFVACAVMAGSAGAVSWGNVTSSYDGKERSTSRGRFYNKDNTYAVNFIRTKDLSPDGNNVYSEMEFHFNGGLTSIGHHTPEHNHSYYVNATIRAELDNASDTVRGSTHSCAQMGMPVPDQCSVWAQPSFTY